MEHPQKFIRTRAAVRLVSVMLATLGAAVTASAQDIGDLEKPESPLVLRDQGSFFIGGQSVTQTQTEVGGFGVFPGGSITVGQMYVQFMIPEREQPKVPVVMVHGGTLSAKQYETTPDGRMGWGEYFVRQGHSVYKPDQVLRGRSGFDQASFNRTRAFMEFPLFQPLITRLSDEVNWTIFRFGPRFPVPFEDTQFPVDSADEFSKQGIPDLLGGNTPALLAELGVRLDGAVLLGHSESGLFPVQAALVNPAGLEGLINLEPASCNSAGFSEDQIARLATIPILVMFGDHLGDIAPGEPAGVGVASLTDCRAFADRIQAAGGRATVVHLPDDLGIAGNSHLFMQDKNNLQIADLILSWIDNVVVIGDED